MRIKVHILFGKDTTRDDMESFVKRFDMYYVNESRFRQSRIISATILKEDFVTLDAIPMIDAIIEDEPGLEKVIDQIHRLKAEGKDAEIDRLIATLEAT